MSSSLSTYLKLRLNPNLTRDARANLLRIDNLGSNFQVDTSGGLSLRARSSIVISPNDPSSGGSGSGGTVDIGSTAQLLDEVRINSMLTTVDGEIRLLDLNGGEYVGIQSPPLVTASYTLTLPTTPGTSGQLLQTDGSGNLSWVTVAGATSVEEVVALWTAGDGVTKVITHNLNSDDLQISIYDNDNSCEVWIDAVEYTDLNTITLRSLAAPGPSGYEVVIHG